MDHQLDMEHRLTEAWDRAKSNSKRIDALELRQDDLEKLTASVSTLAANQNHMERDVREIKADVKTLTEKPAKRWDGIVDKLIWAVLAALLGFVLAQLGLG